MISNASDEYLTIDAGPLIYLARLDALEVLDRYAHSAITPSVQQEVVRPRAAYRLPEITLIDGAIGSGSLEEVSLTSAERTRTGRLGDQVPGLGQGERETIAVAAARGWSAVLFDRRVRRIAESMAVPVVGVAALLFDGTEEPGLLDRRIRRFGSMVNMRLDDLEMLLKRIKER